MIRLLRKYRNPVVSEFRKCSDSKIVYTVDMLKERAIGYLDQNDTAQACEKSFQCCKVAMMSYVTNLEAVSDVKILPPHLDNPWNYRTFSKLCRLITKKVSPDLAKNIMLGWETAFRFHVKGWTQNDLSVEEVKFSMDFVLRFVEIVDKEMSIDREMAVYLKENLFKLDLDELAKAINTESKSGKVGLLLQNSNMRKDLRVKLNHLYRTTYGESLSDVLVKSREACERHFA